MRKSTGMSNSSEISYAARMKSLHSCESDGSTRAIFACFAYQRLSCSFCEECILGSSASTMTKPPFTPRYAAVKSGSAATLSPTSFIALSVRAPAMDAPYATSTATFSLGAHSQ